MKQSLLHQRIDSVAYAPQCDDEHHDGDGAIDVAQRLQAEVVTNLIDEPRDEQPPRNRTASDTDEKQNVESPMPLGSDENETDAREKREEINDDKRIAHRKAKSGKEELHHAPSRNLADGAHLERHLCARHFLAVQGRCRIAAPQIDAIARDEDAGHEKKHNLVGINPIDHEADRKSRENGIEKVAENGTDARKKTRQPTLVQRSLNDKDASRSHWRRDKDANADSPKQSQNSYCEEVFHCRLKFADFFDLPNFRAKIMIKKRNDTTVLEFLLILQPQKSI